MLFISISHRALYVSLYGSAYRGHRRSALEKKNESAAVKMVFRYGTFVYRHLMPHKREKTLSFTA